MYWVKTLFLGLDEGPGGLYPYPLHCLDPCKGLDLVSFGSYVEVIFMGIDFQHQKAFLCGSSIRNFCFIVSNNKLHLDSKLDS